MLADAKHFVLANRHVIGMAPLQAYVSALAFAPSKSMIRRAYKNELPQWLTQPPNMPDDWSNEVLRLEGHFTVVWTVAFSPDNKLLASGSSDGNVRL
jgi:WD40 repeat protein